MRQLCPNCATLIEVPATAAGTDFPCPNCQKPFAVPAAYTPAVVSPPPPADRPAPPPGLAPLPGPQPAAVPAVEATGDQKECGVSLSAGGLAWVPVGSLAVAFLLTFLAWVGTFPGGVRQYTQTPWQAVFRSLSTATLPAELLADEQALETALPATVLFLLPYLLLLLVTLAVAVLERAFTAPDVVTIPGPLAWLPKLWPHRFGLLFGLTAVLFVLLLVQAWRGFGLEQAVHAVADEKARKEERVSKLLADKPDTTPAKQVLAVATGEQAGKFNLSSTWAWDAVLAAHLTALLTAGGRLWLHRRGPKPLPKLMLRY